LQPLAGSAAAIGVHHSQRDQGESANQYKGPVMNMFLPAVVCYLRRTACGLLQLELPHTLRTFHSKRFDHMRRLPVAPSLTSALFALLLTASTSVYGVDPVMNIKDFHDDAVTPPNAPALPNSLNTFGNQPPREYLVSRNHFRQFDFLVSNGSVDSFTFTYTPESEIIPTGFVLQGVDVNGTLLSSVAMPVHLGNPIYPITGSMIAELFTGNQNGTHPLVSPERIRVIENFDVIECSPPNPDATDYSITWVCPNCADTDTQHRSISVVTSTGPLIPFYPQPSFGLDPCGNPTELVFGFRNQNGSHDGGTDLSRV
jgi:hypothetical protein